MTILGCIADDFTGATDLAALLARSGIDVSLRIGIPDADPIPHSIASVEIIALKCRSIAPAEAVSQTVAALSWLQKTGASRFFWKYCSTFDSTPQGNIGVVAEALMEKLGITQTIYCPSFPENGRRVFMGHLFVDDQLLADSPMKDHPLNPMTNSNLQVILSPQVQGKTGLIPHGTVQQGTQAIVDSLAQQQHKHHMIVDAITTDDLHTIARACHSMPLLTGGSALAMPLPHVYREQGLITDNALQDNPHPTVGQGQLVLSGSCSAMTRKQVAQYSKTAATYQLNALTIHKQGIRDAVAWLHAQNPKAPKMIYATAEPETVHQAQKVLGAKQAGKLIEEALAKLALVALQNGIRQFVVAGGETSGAVTKTLGINHLTIGKEITPGVPWTYCNAHGNAIALTLKSGNFGKEDFFAKAFDFL